MAQGALLAAGEKEIQATPDMATMFERFATDPNVSVEKIERLMVLFERNEARRAEMAFNVAMTKAQNAMPPIVADSYNPQTHSRYASYEAVDQVIRPIYTAHGFGCSFNTGEAVKDEHVRVKCKVTHISGHAEHYHVDMPADGKGAKGGDVMTKTHATGSALSYGQRYLAKLIWNLSIKDGTDDDGNAAAGKPEKPAPDGYDAWLGVLQGVAENGDSAFEKAWGDSKTEHRKHLIDTAPKLLAGMRTKARKAGK